MQLQLNHAAPEMQNLPFRTNATSLTDDQLILLDVLFDGPASIRFLRRDVFREQWNLGYSHNLGDNELPRHLRWLCEQGVLEPTVNGTGTRFKMTATGGQLWSEERCPVWERFCTERYTTTLQGRTLMSVIAVSPDIRDDFLRLWPMYPARRRTTTISDYGLVPWRPFSTLHVGLATYSEQHTWTCEEYPVYLERYREHQARLNRERSWWRFVPELQKFTPHAA